MRGDKSFLQRFAKTAAVSLGLAVLAGLPSAQAQNANENKNNNTDIQINDDGSITLDGISVYATRGEKDSFSVPGMVSVISKRQIEELIANSPDDVFKGTPGVEFAGGPRRAGQSPSIRGLSDDSVLVLFDDARQSFDSGHDGKFLIDPDILKRVEVVKGPSSALYGSGAAGGVIAFQTVDPEDLLEPGENMGANIKVGYQSVDNERSAGFTGYGRTSNGAFGFVTHLTVRDADDIKLGSGASLTSDDKIKNGLAKLKFKLSPDTSIITSYIHTSLDGVDPSNAQGGREATSRNPLVNRATTSGTFQTKLTHNPSNNPLLDFQIVGYLTNNEVEKTVIASGRKTTQDIKTLGFSTQNKSKVRITDNTNILFTYGAEYYKDSQTGKDSQSANGSWSAIPDATATFVGTFAQAEITFDKMPLPGTLKITPGIRFDKFQTSSPVADDIDETALSPKLGVTYEPTKWLMLFGNYGEAFRAPSFNEAYATGVHFSLPTPGGVASNEFITNPDLKPEETQGWELGAGLSFNNVIRNTDKLKIKGSYWRSDVKNLIDLEVNIPAGCFGAPFPPCGSGAAFGNTSQNVNVTNAELNGFELELNYDSPLFYARATYAHIDGVDTDTGDYVGILTPDKFFIDAGVKLTSYDARIGARATFADKFTKVNTPGEERDAYSVYDVYATWQPTTGDLKGLSLNIGVDNIFDEDYEVITAGVSEPGRNFKTSIRYKIPLCGGDSCK